MIERHLVIFAKAPVLGQVKRRLAAEIGTVDAWIFYRRTVQQIVRQLSRDPRWRTRLAITPDHMVDASRWWPPVQRMAQGAGDLGIRMDRAMRSLPPGPVVLVGSDIPAMTRRDVAAAFRTLGSNDFVFGPAVDGGYWLVGARRRPRFPYIFSQVRWSSPHALADTLANIAPRDRVGTVRTLEDVDDAAALRRLQVTLNRAGAARLRADAA